MLIYQNDKVEKQINQCIKILKDVLAKDLLGIYLYGSAIVGGLHKYSDIDLFIITTRDTTFEEKVKLTINLLQISGIYMKSSKFPIEITIVNKSKINPWHYPPHFDFQYGEWFREEFESENIEPWKTKEMPELAILITQILLAHKTLFGPNPNLLLSEVPYGDFIAGTINVLESLVLDLESDTRNVLLTYARIWSTVETDTIHSKCAAADWTIHYLPTQYQPVIYRAKAICLGEQNEHWDDLKSLIRPCVDFILSQINKKINSIVSSDYANKSIKIAR